MATKAKQAPKQPADDAKHNVGKVVQVIGPVLDIEFEPERLPEIYNAVVIDHRGNGEGGGTPSIRLTAEVQQHIGRNQVHAVAMTSTDGVVRGMEVVDTGKPITVPVGQASLGRILNVLGEPVDEGDPIPPDAERWPIQDRKSTRLNSSHLVISYAVFCLKKKNRIFAMSISTPQEQVFRLSVQDCWGPPL